MNVVHLEDYVIFRKHLCISFELLSMNLFEFLKVNDFNVSCNWLPCRDSTIIWFADSLSSCCTLWSISKCFRLSTATWSQRTSCWRRATSQALKWLTLAVPPLLTNACTLTSSLASTGRQRSCLASRTTVQSICGVSAVSWPSCISATQSSQGKASKTRCVALSKWLECQTTTS